ncbi:MAG: hypothetical protein FWF28_00855 [Micrococcales bacterium]|nr:hypothetical protein [Micrococcales bacterium]
MRSTLNPTKIVRYAAIPLVLVVGVLVSAASCSTGGAAAQKQEDTSRQDSYAKLVAAQPAAQLQDYSPTRAAKNFWITTWGDKPGKLSYVYLMNSTGAMIGYYIFVGLPVSYCTSLVPPVSVEDPNGDGNVLVPQPSVDGTYSSQANCSTMYGQDATTGAYIEYTVGMGINALVYSEPLPLQNEAALKPLGFTTLDQAANLTTTPTPAPTPTSTPGSSR